MSPSFNDLIGDPFHFPKNGSKFVLNENGANQLLKRRCLDHIFSEGDSLFFKNGKPIEKYSKIVWMRMKLNDEGLIGVPRDEDYFSIMIAPGKER